jgi:hypothetical protein
VRSAKSVKEVSRIKIPKWYLQCLFREDRSALQIPIGKPHVTVPIAKASQDHGRRKL